VILYNLTSYGLHFEKTRRFRKRMKFDRITEDCSVASALRAQSGPNKTRGNDLRLVMIRRTKEASFQSATVHFSPAHPLHLKVVDSDGFKRITLQNSCTCFSDGPRKLTESLRPTTIAMIRKSELNDDTGFWSILGNVVNQVYFIFLVSLVSLKSFNR
jgi:hypothetical protein